MQRRLSDIPIIVDENGEVAVSSGRLIIAGEAVVAGVDKNNGAVHEENGNQVLRSLNGLGGVTFDKKGNIYFASGQIGTTPFTPDIVSKYNSKGEFMWRGSTILAPPPGFTSNGGSRYLTIDNKGDVLLCGRKWGSESDLWKLSGATGEIIWSRFTGMAIGTGLLQVATDSENNIITIGSGQIRADKFMVMKYDSSGQLLWGRIGLPLLGGLNPVGVGCCVDKDDNVYVAIQQAQGIPGSDNVIAIKYDKFGNEIKKIFAAQSFLDEFPDRWNYFAHAIACDNVGNVFVTFKANNGSGARRAGLFSLSPDGVERWETDVFGLNTPLGTMAVDSTGNLFIPQEFLGIIYVDGTTGEVLTDYNFQGNFPDRVTAVEVSRPDALIGPIKSGRSNLFDSGHYLDYSLPLRGNPLSTGDVHQQPGDINTPFDAPPNVTSGIYRANRDLDTGADLGAIPLSVENFNTLSTSRIMPAPAWIGGNRYEIDDKVFHESIFYNCVTAHTTIAEPGGNPLWEVITSPTHPFDLIPEYGGKGFNDRLDPEATTPQVYTVTFAAIETASGDPHPLNGTYQCMKIHGGDDSQWLHLRYQPPQSSIYVKVKMTQDETTITLSRDGAANAWISEKEYFIGNPVIHNNIFYGCIQGHKTPPKEPGVTIGWENYWEIITLSQVTIFEVTETGDMGALLKIFTRGNEPGNEGKLGVASAYPGAFDHWSPSISYLGGSRVAYRGQFYTANTANAGQPPFGSAVWDRIT